MLQLLAYQITKRHFKGRDHFCSIRNSYIGELGVRVTNENRSGEFFMCKLYYSVSFYFVFARKSEIFYVEQMRCMNTVSAVISWKTSNVLP